MPVTDALRAAQPCLALDGPAAIPPWPIVLYFHHVGEPLGHHTSVSVEEFARAIDRIAMHGTFFAPGCDAPALDGELRFLITFDDGYEDTIDNAVPVLRDHGASAVLFVTTADFRPPHADVLAGLPHIRDKLALLLRPDSGWRVGSHSHEHVRLDRLCANEIVRQREHAARLIVDAFGVEPWGFSYPYGLLPPTRAHSGGGTREFATTRVPAVPWSADEPIRRVYLPARRHQEWDRLLAAWRNAYLRAAESLDRHSHDRPGA